MWFKAAPTIIIIIMLKMIGIIAIYYKREKFPVKKITSHRSWKFSSWFENFPINTLGVKGCWTGARLNYSRFWFLADLRTETFLLDFRMHAEQVQYWFPGEYKIYWKCMIFSAFPVKNRLHAIGSRNTKESGEDIVRSHCWHENLDKQW